MLCSFSSYNIWRCERTKREKFIANHFLFVCQWHINYKIQKKSSSWRLKLYNRRTIISLQKIHRQTQERQKRTTTCWRAHVASASLSSFSILGFCKCVHVYNTQSTWCVTWNITHTREQLFVYNFLINLRADRLPTITKAVIYKKLKAEVSYVWNQKEIRVCRSSNNVKESNFEERWADED